MYCDCELKEGNERMNTKKKKKTKCKQTHQTIEMKAKEEKKMNIITIVSFRMI